MGDEDSKPNATRKYDLYFITADVPSVFELYLLREWVRARYSTATAAFVQFTDSKANEYIRAVLPRVKLIDKHKITKGLEYKARLILNRRRLRDITFYPNSATIVASLDTHDVSISDLVKLKITETPVVFYNNSHNKKLPDVLEKYPKAVRLTPKQLLRDLKNRQDGIGAITQFLLGEELPPQKLGYFLHDMNLIAKSLVFNWNGIRGVYYLVLAAIREYYSSGKPVTIKAIASDFVYKVLFSPSNRGLIDTPKSCNKCYTWSFFNIFEQYEPKSKDIKEQEETQDQLLGASGIDKGLADKPYSTSTQAGPDFYDPRIQGGSDIRSALDDNTGDSVPRGSIATTVDGSNKQQVNRSARGTTTTGGNNKSSMSNLADTVDTPDENTKKRLEELETRFQKLLEEYEQLQGTVSDALKGKNNYRDKQSNQKQMIKSQSIDQDMLPTLSQFDPKTGQIAGSYIKSDNAAESMVGNNTTKSAGYNVEQTSATNEELATHVAVRGTQVVNTDEQYTNTTGNVNAPEIKDNKMQYVKDTHAGIYQPDQNYIQHTEAKSLATNMDKSVDNSEQSVDDANLVAQDPIQAIIDELEK